MSNKERDDLIKKYGIENLNIERGEQIAAELIECKQKNWVLIIGEEVSEWFSTENSAEHRIREIIRKNVGNKLLEERENKEQLSMLASAVEMGNMDTLKNILFGEVWNGVAVLDDYKKQQEENRKIYAKKLAKTDQINIEALNTKEKKSRIGVKMANMLDMFADAILTFCQDETVEALMEYDQAIYVQENVCTPYDLVASPKWKSRLDKLLNSDNIWCGVNEEGRILVKLCGSCEKPNHMLLSRHDFETYYGVNEKIYTVEFLKTVFINANLLFIGIEKDAFEEAIPKEIRTLLEITKEMNMATAPRRYLLQKKDLDNDKGFFARLTDENSLNQVKKENEKIEISIGENGKLDGDKIYNEVKKRYYRRQIETVPQAEISILKRNVLTLQNDKNWKAWDMENIKLLAMVINNLADFYDLKKVIDFTDQTLKKDDLRKRLQGEIKAGLSEKSYQFYQILREYEGGFPSSFFKLLEKEEKERNEYKKAAIQLANRGICVKGQQRKNVQRRVQFTDRIMLTVINGCEQLKRNLQEKLIQSGNENNESYYFVTDALISDEVANRKKTPDSFSIMCKNLGTIMEKRNEEYAYYCALMETEMAHVLKILMNLDKDLTWKPEFIYYLFLNSRMIPKINQSILTSLQFEFLPAKREKMEETQIRRIMNYYVQAILCHQSFDDEEQEKALHECELALDLIEEIPKEIKKEKFFILQVHIRILMSQIYERRSIIKELKQWENQASGCTEQEKMLTNMKEELENLENLLMAHKVENGLAYEEFFAISKRLWGDCFFGLGRCLRKNETRPQKYRRNLENKKKKLYKEAIDSYNEALEYYNLYPQRYELQRADILRIMADVEYQKAKADGIEKGEGNWFDKLYKAYFLYRKNLDIYGMANVLQSMGKTVDYKQFENEEEKGKRSTLFFYKVANELYKYLNMEWGQFVVEKLLKEAIKNEE